MELKLEILDRIRAISKDAWDALVSEGDSPFVEWTWLDCLEEACCVGEKAGWIPYHLTLYRDDKLIAAAPAYIKTNSEGEFVFDWSWADLAHRMGLSYYPKLVLAVPFTPASGGRVLVAKGEDRNDVTRVFAEAVRKVTHEGNLRGAHILFPREEEAATWTEAGYAHRYGVQFQWTNEGYKTFDDFLARFNSKRRHQIKRERAQAAKDGVTIETLREGDLTEQISDEMHELYAITVDKFFYGRRYLNARFFQLVRERFASRLAWVVAKKDNAIIAGAFNIKGHDRLYGRYWGAKVDMPFLHFNVCYYHGIDEAISSGLRVFEPGAGGEHKKVRGFQPTITHSVHWIEDARLRSVLSQYVDRERAAIQAHVDEERAAGM
jgi:predicted N-acyltransferase